MAFFQSGYPALLKNKFSNKLIADVFTTSTSTIMTEKET